MISDETNYWKTLLFRQNVVNKIEETIQMAGIITSKTSREMEVEAFQEAKSRDEYLSFVARFILRKVEQSNSIPPAAVQNIVQNIQNIPDPINVSRNLANQGTGGQTDKTNWKTLQFRQNVVNKIEEAMLTAGMLTGGKMEEEAFQEAKSRDQYLRFVARLILRVREMRTGGQTMGAIP